MQRLDLSFTKKPTLVFILQHSLFRTHRGSFYCDVSWMLLLLPPVLRTRWIRRRPSLLCTLEIVRQDSENVPLAVSSNTQVPGRRTCSKDTVYHLTWEAPFERSQSETLWWVVVLEHVWFSDIPWEDKVIPCTLFKCINPDT